MSKLRIIRLPEVCSRLGICPDKVYKMIKAGKFKEPIKICGSRANGWLESDVDDYIQAAVVASRPPTKDTNGIAAPAVCK